MDNKLYLVKFDTAEYNSCENDFGCNQCIENHYSKICIYKSLEEAENKCEDIAKQITDFDLFKLFHFSEYPSMSIYELEIGDIVSITNFNEGPNGHIVFEYTKEFDFENKEWKIKKKRFDKKTKNMVDC